MRVWLLIFFFPPPVPIVADRQDIHNRRFQRARVHEHGGDVQRGNERVDAAAAHADQAQRRVVHSVPQLAVRDRRLQRAVADDQRREVQPGDKPVDAGGGHVQPAQQLRHRGAGRHDIRGRRFQRRDHHPAGGVLQRPHGRMVPYNPNIIT